MDARPLTLRQLWWMARERKRVSGEAVAWLACVVVAAAGGDPPDPAALNPYRTEPPPPPPPKSDEQRETESKVGWGVVLKGLFGKDPRA